MANRENRLLVAGLSAVALATGGFAAHKVGEDYIADVRASAQRDGEDVGFERGREVGSEEAICTAQAYRMLGPAPASETLNSDGEAAVGHIVAIARDCN